MNVHVDLGRSGYDVVVAPDARHHLSDVVAQRAPRARSAVLITSASLAGQSWFDLDTGCDQHVVTVPEGEAAKTMRVAEDVLEQLAAIHVSRDDVVVGVGGGAVTDLAGFVAATYLRGVGVVHVPTSLVGQVDAAIGGKTGVNLSSGKNLVGAFHQPLGVLCDATVLSTLPARERASGLGEVAKCWLLDGRGPASLAAAPLSELVEMSVRLKADAVARDERDGGTRVLLNYGHTLAHALELLALRRDPNELRHGEAVAIGLVFAARLALELGRVEPAEVERHHDVLAALGLVAQLPVRDDVDAIVAVMGFDKKAHHDLSFVLAGSDGFSLVEAVNPAAVRAALERWRGEK